MALVAQVKIAAMLRVRNEARWLREVLGSIQLLTTDILVFDDNSTDDSREIAADMGCAVMPSPFAPDDTDESRDKNLLLDAVRGDFNPDYILSIDGDEVLEAGAADKIRAKLSPQYSLYCFPIKYLWNDRQHYRADGVYGRYQQWRMFSLINQPANLQFVSTAAGGNFHCGNAPKGLRGGGCMMPVDILHLGYMDREDRIRKYEFYNRVDPGNRLEDRYRHIVVGDLFPVESTFSHGGPLKIYSLPADKWPSCATSSV